eukprot:CAMPEP_0202913394 /NCGR_PEP_ID=MMETSP1392-20130828/60378_1 /ASSEMBLY_ACC=CAM_ASM_000868 /TAXON_ID=225041 /ORGANISM="Chlamydomonas chlamydogama, Strain SAG 11-48b" /LENGTH=63 /DNA_ID=CAMNT_0049604637 /DNA_START=11 /DNA_END=202 /DNA_ORIENTATION=+
MEAARNVVAARVEPCAPAPKQHGVRVACTAVCSVLSSARVITLARFGAALGLAMVSKSHRPGL